MADDVFIRLDGVEEVVRALKAMPVKIRGKAVRPALRKSSLVLRNEAKAIRKSASALSRVDKRRKPSPFRIPGTVLRRISLRNSKFAKQAGDEGVFVGVKPLRGKTDTRRYGRASARNPNDPFYWRFLEFGTRKMAARPFLGPAAKAKGSEVVRNFLRESMPAIEKLNRKNA